jgi:hypothetical protein
MAKNYIDFAKWCETATIEDIKKFFERISKLYVNRGNSGQVGRYFDSLEWIEKLNNPTSDGGILRDAKAYLRNNFHVLPQEKDTWFK